MERTQYPFDNNGLVRTVEGTQWTLFDREGKQVGASYSYIEEWGEGYYKVERGARKNIMRPDGTEVLAVWHNDVFKVQHGLFLFSNTIRKSKNNPKTRYTYGLAHVNGDIIFPMIFDRAWWLEKGDGIYAEIGTKPYILTLDGCIYDPAREHLPQIVDIDYNEFLKKLTTDADADPTKFRKLRDNFPYNGVKDTVCEGCIYADGIKGHGEGCGRLFIKSFRERYLKGRCEYYKTDIRQPSLFEELDKLHKEKEKAKEEKEADTFALRVVRRFVNERLDGDIQKLATVDLNAIQTTERDDQELTSSNVINSVMALVFADTWPDLTVQSIEQYNYCCTMMNDDIRLLGSNIADQYMMGLQKFCPSKELTERAIRVNHLLHTIGNFWVLPNKPNDKDTLSNYKDATPHYRGYMDRYLKAMYAAFSETGKVDMRMKGLLYKNCKLMTDYQGQDGFKHFVQRMMLEDYTDEQCVPKDIFPLVWSYMNDLDRDTYLSAVTTFCDFCEYAIPRRSQRIIERLRFRAPFLATAKFKQV